jgi:hypothetical protein
VSKDITTGIIYAAVMIKVVSVLLIVPAIMYRPDADPFQSLCALHKDYPPAYPEALAGVCHEQQTINP